MENETFDELTKNIISESRLELTNPTFNSALMTKINAAQRRKQRYRTAALYFLAFVSIDFTVFSIISLLNLNLSHLTIFLQQGIFSKPIITIYLLLMVIISLTNSSSSFSKKSN